MMSRPERISEKSSGHRLSCKCTAEPESSADRRGKFGKGQTAQAIYDKSQELINQIQRLDNNLEETTNYIRHVLAVYKAKDEMLKAIMASQNMV